MALRTTTRRRRDTEPPGRALLKGAAITALLAVLGWVAVSAYNGVPGRDYTTMYVDVPHAGNLLQHDQVRIAGVRVGQVQSKTITADGNVRLQLQIEPGVPVPADTTVALRASGLLGARFVQLVPGRSARNLAPGATIRATRDALTYGVPEALDTFDRETRGALGTTLRELGKGTLGNGTRLNEAIRLSSEQMHRFQLLADSIRPEAALRLLPSLDRGFGALDASREDIGRLFNPAADALRPFVDERRAIRAALSQAPGALAAADAGLRDGRRLLGAARALATEASRTLPRAPAGLRTATALLRESHAPLARTATLLRDARPAIPAALRLTSSVSPVLGPLRHGLEDLIPMLTQIGRHGCDFANFGAVFRSVTGFGGTGEGPNGPAMSFRLKSISPKANESAGLRDTAGLVVREGYPAPCKYLAREPEAVIP